MISEPYVPVGRKKSGARKKIHSTLTLKLPAA